MSSSSAYQPVHIAKLADALARADASEARGGEDGKAGPAADLFGDWP